MEKKETIKIKLYVVRSGNERDYCFRVNESPEVKYSRPERMNYSLEILADMLKYFYKTHKNEIEWKYELNDKNPNNFTKEELNLFMQYLNN